MATIGKQTIAQTFKFNCDRFLRFKLANEQEKKEVGIEDVSLGFRPGLQLMIDAANKWEADKYQDLIDCANGQSVLHVLKPDIDPRIGRKAFDKFQNIFESLDVDQPPLAIIEGEFQVPDSVSNAFKIIHDEFGVSVSRANPDIILVRKFPTGAPLINTIESDPEYELHIIDVKMASEASLKHFTEVTYYALALAEAIKVSGLDKRFRVSAKGLVWPGSHNNLQFKNLFRSFQVSGSTNAIIDALYNTLEEVPYEVYEVHVRNFLDERILKVLRQPALEAAWHVSPKCQLCDYLEYCSSRAKSTDHLSRITWINYGQAELMRQRGIYTTAQLYQAISERTKEWDLVQSENFQLKADQLGIGARSKAIQTGLPELIKERKCGYMPKWTDMNIFLTIHFDPGSGLTFAMGAKRVYFLPNRNQGDLPVFEEKYFIVDRINEIQSSDTEKNRLVEFVDIITTWYLEAHSFNEQVRLEKKSNGERDNDRGKVKVHSFFWNQMEVKQFLRMIERHLVDPKVVEKVELLIRLFPPDGMLPVDVEAFKSQPGTVVKNVLKQLVGLPVNFDYNLFECANALFPSQKEDGSVFRYKPRFGFYTELNDQIPFERAYELWKDDVYLKRLYKTDGTGYSEEEKKRGSDKFTRNEIEEGLKGAVKMHLEALQHIVTKLREKCGEQLTLKKSPFFAPKLVQSNVPEMSRQLIVFQKLNSISHEIENKHQLSLPVSEKEARFVSIRGLMRMSKESELGIIDSLVSDNPKLASSTLWGFTFSENSRDAKIKEGDFLCALSNEDPQLQLDLFWYNILDKTYYEAEEILNKEGLNINVKKKVSDLLQVSVVKLSTVTTPPYVILKIKNLILFQFAVKVGLLNMDQPMILDLFNADFESKEIESVLRMIGGKPPKRKAKK